MAQLIWTEPALQDVEKIAEYIALDNIRAAQKLVKMIIDGVERLEKHPYSGRRPPEFKKNLYREIIIGPCRIFYKVNNNKVCILYVMRGERKLRKYLLEERRKEDK